VNNRVLLDKPIRRMHLDDIKLDKSNILKEKLNKLKGFGLGLYISKQGQMVDFCKEIMRPQNYIK
jgi:hypothetical protein